jgi:hypothetical protein
MNRAPLVVGLASALASTALACGSRDTSLPPTPAAPGRVECISGLTKTEWFFVKQTAQNVLRDQLSVAKETTTPSSEGTSTYWGSITVLGGSMGSTDGLGYGSRGCDLGYSQTRPDCKTSLGSHPYRFCSELNCTDGHAKVAVAMTDPGIETVASDHHVEYPVIVEPPSQHGSSSNSGGSWTIAYMQNPSAVWQIDESKSGFTIQSTLAANVSVRDATGRELDVSFTGKVNLDIAKTGGVPTTLHGDLTMSEIAGGPLSVSWTLDETNQVVGTVIRSGIEKVGSFRLATPNELKVFWDTEWTSACD